MGLEGADFRGRGVLNAARGLLMARPRTHLSIMQIRKGCAAMCRPCPHSFAKRGGVLKALVAFHWHADGLVVEDPARNDIHRNHQPPNSLNTELHLGTTHCRRSLSCGLLCKLSPTVAYRSAGTTALLCSDHRQNRTLCINDSSALALRGRPIARYQDLRQGVIPTFSI